jgi:hypothetical protein
MYNNRSYLFEIFRDSFDNFVIFPSSNALATGQRYVSYFKQKKQDKVMGKDVTKVMLLIIGELVRMNKLAGARYRNKKHNKGVASALYRKQQR